MSQHPIDSKRQVLEGVSADLMAWARRTPGDHGQEAMRHLGLAEAALLYPSAIHLETAEGHVAMALAWRGASGKQPLRWAIPKAREWLRGELAEAAKTAREAIEAEANPAAWNEPPDRLDEQETA